MARGALDLLLEIGWVKPRGRRRSPGRPLTFGTSDAFLSHFGLASLDALPGKDDLRGIGLLDTRIAAEIDVPRPQAEGEGEGDDKALPAEEDAARFFMDHLQRDD
jgi:segregation and condensation protein B